MIIRANDKEKVSDDPENYGREENRKMWCGKEVWRVCISGGTVSRTASEKAEAGGAAFEEILQGRANYWDGESSLLSE